ncbi:MAG: hypothetical protein BWY28_01583 [bacterium ADurb.Bin236]|nr:MAG: hypothetical protein BWY28_01583 [bacterium ADurb.Bin236]
MSKRNWGMISSHVFQGFCGTIIYFEDSNATIFDRPGKDGGQDILSGDKQTVYQAKYIGDESASKAISEAKKEATKIKEYRESGHTRHNQWRDVNNWVLMTNAVFNPPDDETWNKQVVPLFREMGLTATYWNQGILDAKLDEHPEIERSYFQNQTRVFLTLPEARERFEYYTPFLSRATNAELIGRDTELDNFDAFLSSDKLFCVICGPGGIGKTKFLIEAGAEKAATKGWQVLWANIAAMTDGSWYEAIVPERTTLLLVDEPEDEQILQKLMEQIGGRTGRSRNWKVALTVRSPKDPIFRYLESSRMKSNCEFIDLKPITDNATEFCLGLINSSNSFSEHPDDWKQNAAEIISSKYDGFPIWISLAIHILEKKGRVGDFPDTADELAEEYLREIYSEQDDFPKEHVQGLLRWTALIRTVNREDDALLKIILNETGIGDITKLRELIKRLIERRVIIKRGAYDRLIEIKPDVIRDYILQEWLIYDPDTASRPLEPSEDAKRIVQAVINNIKQGFLRRIDNTILISLARTEWQLRILNDERGREVSLIGHFFRELHSITKDLTASARILAAGTIADIAPVRPMDVIEFSKIVRMNRCNKEEVYELTEKRIIGQDDVILELAWPVMHAATGARGEAEKIKVLSELCELVDAEEIISKNSPAGLPNDGKRAMQMLKRVLEGGQRFLEQYDEQAKDIVMERLEQIEQGTLQSDKLKSLEIMLKSITAVERQQSSLDGYKITIQKYIVLPRDHVWRIRDKVKTKVKQLLEKDMEDYEIINMLWASFRSMHSNMLSSLRILVDKDDEDKDIKTISLFKSELKDNLKWAYETLSKKENMNHKEITAARKVWEWHYRYDKDHEFKEAADSLEKLYMRNELVKEFDPLVNDANWSERRRIANEKATELASKDENAISEFVDRALEFFGDANKLANIYSIAYALGQMAPEKDCITTHLKNAFKKPGDDPHFVFATYIAGSWVYALRERKEDALSVLKMLYELPASAEEKVPFIREAYRPYYSDNYKLISDEEVTFLISAYDAFKSADKLVEYLQIIGWTFTYNWEDYKRVVGAVLNDMNASEIENGFKTLANSIYHGVRQLIDDNKKELIPDNIGEWLLDLMLEMPMPDVVGDVTLPHIEMILDHSSRPSIKWLVDALNYRLTLVGEGETEKSRVIPLRLHLSKYVQPINSHDLSNDAARKDIEALLGFIDNKGWLGYVLPEYLFDVDPDGLLIPDIVKERLDGFQSKDADAVWKWSRIAGQYPMNSDAWRKMAISACRFADRADEKTRLDIFVSLIERKIEGWSSSPGEVPPHFYEKVEKARQMLESETDVFLKSFWEWNHENAQSELQHHIEIAKEMSEE